MRCYLVGGAVRDRLLGAVPSDRDWLVVDETHASMVAQGFRPVGQTFTTYLHPASLEQYSLPRAEPPNAPDAAADEASIVAADLAARDLTINAMAISPENALIDPFGGRSDLEARVLRHPSPAFADDPVRVMRVVRFASELGFTVACETAALCRSICAAERFTPAHRHRLYGEFMRALRGTYPRCLTGALRCTGMLTWLTHGSHDDDEAARNLDLQTFEAVLDAARATPASEPALFAAASFVLGTKALCERLGPPIAAARAANGFAHHHRACLAPRSVAPEAIATLLEATRALQKRAALDVLLEAAALHAPSGDDEAEPATARADIEAALHAARGVHPRDMAQHVEGPALGAALRTARINAIAHALRR